MLLGLVNAIGVEQIPALLVGQERLVAARLGRDEQDQRMPALVSIIPMTILTGVEGSSPRLLSQPQTPHEREREHDDPERVDRVGDDT